MTYLRILSPSLVPLPHAKSLFLSSFTRHTHGSPTPTAAAPPPEARALDKLRGCVRRGTESTTPLISIHHGTRRRKSSSIHAFAFLFFLLLFLAPRPPPSHPRSLRSLVIFLSAHYHPVLLSPSSTSQSLTITHYHYHHQPIIITHLHPTTLTHSSSPTNTHSHITHHPAIPAPSPLPIPHYHSPSPITGSHLRPITRPVTRLRHPPSAPHQCLLTKVTHVDCLK